jgi:hypothetical protein
MTSPPRLQPMAIPTHPANLTVPGDCDGSAWIITNLDWPRGTLPYRERCDGCVACRPADYPDEVTPRA